MAISATVAGLLSTAWLVPFFFALNGAIADATVVVLLDALALGVLGFLWGSHLDTKPFGLRRAFSRALLVSAVSWIAFWTAWIVVACLIEIARVNGAQQITDIVGRQVAYGLWATAILGPVVLLLAGQLTLATLIGGRLESARLGLKAL